MEILGIDLRLNTLADDILNNQITAGESVIVIGCGMVGAETAYHLARQDKKVIVFEALVHAMNI